MTLEIRDEDLTPVWIEGFGPVLLFDESKAVRDRGKFSKRRGVPALPWPIADWPDDLPEPGGVKGKGHTSGSHGETHHGTKTKIGRIGEHIAERVGLVKRAHRKRDKNGKLVDQHPIDGMRDGVAVEVKTRLTTASEYRVAMKDSAKYPEITDKRRWADENTDGKASTMLIVVDVENRTAWVFAREGIANGSVHPKKLKTTPFEFIEKIDVTDEDIAAGRPKGEQ